MTVKELREQLANYLDDCKVVGWFEGNIRMDVDEVWMDNHDRVVLGNEGDKIEWERAVDSKP